MLLSFDNVSKMILSGKLLNIAGSEGLLKKLPKGNWIGGSTEYFMTKSGGVTTNEQLFITEFPFDNFNIMTYDNNSISSIATDAYNNGFSVLILPFDSNIHKLYAEKASEFEDMFVKNITGWVSGTNLNVESQTPITINGLTGEILTDKAVVAHVCVPDDKAVSLGIVNIFRQNEDSPTIEFTQDGFSVTTCLVDGKEVSLADYIQQNDINTKLPLVGDYSGIGINTSFKSIKDGVVQFYAPVFPDIKYKTASNISNYVDEFNDQLKKLDDLNNVFSCNCILNFVHGELEGKAIDTFSGPITFGEIAYQLLNQTLVYVTVS